MYIRRKNSAIKYSIGIVFGVVLYSEVFVYILQSWFWQDLSCLNNDPTCTKILFVADPQIQGEHDGPWPLNNVFIWDSDRYLKKTFKKVINHFKPDVLVYLGDLMDEGSISTMRKYNEYVKRLADIFEIPYPVVQVWLPGDNDIGGENEPVNWEKVSAFDKHFHQDQVVHFKNTTFYKVNAITWDPHYTVRKYSVETDIQDDTFKIAVSHYPLMLRGVIMREMDEHVKPQIYFCAHDHESKYMLRNADNFKQTTPYYDRQILTIPFSVDARARYEIHVPTCSYRMGTSNIGYGAAILDNHNAQLRYTVFWTPQRFVYLIGYLIVASLLAIQFCCILCHCHTSRLGNLPLYNKF